MSLSTRLRRLPSLPPVAPLPPTLPTPPLPRLSAWARGARAALAVSFVSVAVALATAAAAAPAELVLTPEQVRALGLATQAVAPAGAAAAAGPRGLLLAGTVTVPDTQQRVLAAPLPGLVERLNVSVGDAVRAGQVLATLRSPVAAELQRDTRAAAAQAALAQSAQVRDEQLYDEGLIARSRLEATRAQALQARLLADERRQALAAAQGGAGGVLTLTAPIAGTVVERLASVGQRVDASAPLLKLAGLGTWWVELQVPVRVAAAVRLGDAVQLEEPPLPARVVAVGRAVDPGSQTVMVRARLQVAEGTVPSGLHGLQGLQGLHLGQAVQARLDTAAATGGAGGALWQVPAEAVVVHAGQSWVFVQAAPGRFRPVAVQASGQAPGRVSAPGLAAGAAVAVKGTAALKALLVAQDATPAAPPATSAVAPPAAPAAAKPVPASAPAAR